MADNLTKRKQFLFVDNDAEFLGLIRDMFSALSQGAWEIHLAQNHAQALAVLQKQKLDLIVLDVGMPVVDGVQFLRLLNRTHPGQQVVMLTGLDSEERRKECLANGALMFLQKPTEPGGYESIFAALDALAGVSAAEGFSGVMRRVGLQEVLQMECLGTKSSVLEVFTNRTRGRIYILDGVIVHAELGDIHGEVALYSMLALRGGEFNLLAYAEPAQRTIQGQWEFLLMEAARLNDEAVHTTNATAAPAETSREAEPVLPPTASDTEYFAAKLAGQNAIAAIIEEVVLCSGAGEVLYDWQCPSLERRLSLLKHIEEQAAHLSSLAPIGRLDRLEIFTTEGRAICQILPERRLFVRSSGGQE